MSAHSSTPEAASAVRSAIALFSVLAVMKLIALGFGIRLLVNPTLPTGAESSMRVAVLRNAQAIGTVLIVWYAIGVILCILIALGLKRRAPWAYAAGIFYAIGHALGILAIPFFGFAFLLSGIIGMATAAMLVRAERANAFAQESADVAPRERGPIQE